MRNFTQNQIELTLFVVDIGGYIDWQSESKGFVNFKNYQSFNKFLKHITYNRFIWKHKAYRDSKSITIYLY